MADRVDTIILKYIQNFSSAEKGFTKIQGTTRELNRETKAWGAEVDDVLKSLKQAAKQKKVELLDTQPLADLRGDLNDIEAETRKLAEGFRAAFAVDPKVRRVAGEQLTNIRNYRKELDSVTSILDQQKGLIQQLAAAEALRAQQIASGNTQITKRNFLIGDLKRQLAASGGGDDGITDLLASLARGGKDIERTSKDLEGAGRSAASFGGKMDGLLARLRQVFPVLRGLAVVLATALVPAFIALGGAIAGAGVALVGMAGAAASAAGPAFTVLAGFFSRLGAVMQVVQAQQQATNKALQGGTGPASQLAAATDALTQAQQRSVQAAQGIGNAERALSEAIRSARQGIVDAIEARAQAYRAVQDAAASVAQAEVDGMRAIRDSAEEASDAVRDLRSAQLDLQDARLDTRQAILDLQELRKESGLTGDSFGDLFTKFTDVDVKFDKEAFSKAIEEAGGDVGSQEAIDLERAVLRVKQARQAEKDATDGVSDAVRSANDAQREANKLAREGLAAYQPYTDAVRALADAQENYTKQAAEATRLQRQGVAGNSGVISAEQALTQARQAAAQAQKDLNRQEAETGKVKRGLTPQMERYLALLKQLSPAEAGFALRLIGGKKAILDFIRQGTDPMFRSLSRAIDRFAALRGSLTGLLKLKILKDALAGIGNAFASVIDDAAKFATSFEGISIFARGAKLARNLILEIGGAGLKNTIRLLDNLGRIFGPALLDSITLIVNALGGLNRKLAGVGSKNEGVRNMVSAFKELLRLAGAVGEAIVSFAAAASGPGAELVKWIRQGVQAFNKWLQSTEGKESLKEFFAEAIPFVKTMIKFVVKFSQAFLQAFEFFAPALKDLFDGINLVLDVFNFFANLLNRLPAPVKVLLTLFIPFFGQVRGGFLAARLAIKGFSIAVGELLIALTFLGAVGEKVVDIIVGAFEFLVKAVKSILGIGSPSKVFLEIGKDVILGFAAGLKAVAGLLVDAASFIVSTVIDGIKAAASLIVDAAEWYVTTYIDTIKKAAGLLLSLGKFIVRKILDGVKALASLIFSAAKWYVTTYIKGVKKVVSLIVDIGKWLVRRIIEGVKSLASAVFALGKWFVETEVHGFKRVASTVLGIGKWLVERIIAGAKAVFNLIGTFARDFADRTVRGFKNIASKFFELGRDLVRGLIKGIKSMSGKVLDAIKDLGGGIVGKIGGVLGINSPSKVFQDIGKSMGEGLIIGIKKQAPRVESAVKNMVGGLGGMDLPVTASVQGAVAARARGPRVDTLTPAMARASAQGTHIEHQDVHLPAPPAGGLLDPKYAAVQFARELKRRGR